MSHKPKHKYRPTYFPSKQNLALTADFYTPSLIACYNLTVLKTTSLF